MQWSCSFHRCGHTSREIETIDANTGWVKSQTCGVAACPSIPRKVGVALAVEAAVADGAVEVAEHELADAYVLL